LFFGEPGQQAIRRAFVVVVGVGGVGSHAAHMLARAGVGRLRLVDFDNVTL
jgi:tRNA A37 threonylcarbamoyladenosine dehydratase